MVNAGKAKFLPFPYFRIFPLKCSVFNLPYYSIKEGRNKVKSGENPLPLSMHGKRTGILLKKGLDFLKRELQFSGMELCFFKKSKDFREKQQKILVFSKLSC